MNNSFGLLMVMMQPPATMEEEFNAWYDTEHLPERAVLPGFLSARRFVCTDGYPRYMALYDLDSEAALSSSAYMAISGERFSPWTRRVTSRMPVYRVAATQAYPGNEVSLPTARLVLIKIRRGPDEQALISSLRAALDGCSDVRQCRLFSSSEEPGDFFVMLGLSGPWPSLPDFVDKIAAQAQLAFVNTYAPYDPAK